MSAIAAYTAQSGLLRQQRVEVGGGDDSGRNIESRKLSSVLARLRIRRHPHPGELVLRILDESAQCMTADATGADQDDSQRHECTLSGPVATNGAMVDRS